MGQKSVKGPTAECCRDLLPPPRDLTPRSGSFAWPRSANVRCGPWAEPLAATLEALRTCCRAHAGSELLIDGRNDAPTLEIRRSTDRDIPTLPPPPRADQAYTLTIAATGVRIDAATAVGAAFGVRTLIQLIELSGATLPALEIRDEPDFAVRGLSYDISRGRVPTMDFLYRLVDRLAALKSNHLELYTEHTFAFAFDPEISAGASPMTPDEIVALDAYCRARFIELTPSLACFGHMARVLSLPQYRHLAEVDLGRPWNELTWRERVRGLTIDASNPASRALLARMLDEYLPLFSSPRVNVCCDETFDLAKGRGRPRADQIGVGGLFLEHVLWLRDHCARHGKQIMIWGDMLKHHPEIVPKLPRDVIVLNWGYDAACDYDSTALFTAAELPTWVCPGTSGWNRFVHDINTADLNIRRYAEAGLKHGATGLLNTEWGDDGHVAPPGCAALPIALGAALGWNAATPARAQFDAAYARLFLGQGGAEAIAAWRSANEASAMTRIWPALYGAPDAAQLLAKFDVRALEGWAAAAAIAREAALALRERAADAFGEASDLVLGFSLHSCAALRFAHLPTEPVESLIAHYETAWARTSRPSGLDEVVATLRRAMSDAHARAPRRE